MATNTKIFYKLTASLWLYVTCYSQSIPNNKFAIFLNYLKENAKDEIDFLPVDNFFKFLVTFSVWPGMTKLPKIQVCYFFGISQEKSRLKFIFCMRISLKVSFKLIQWFLMGMNKHSQNFQNRKFGMSYNIYLVKEVREMKLIFCMQINILKVS